MPGLCVRCLFAQRTSDYMSSVRYRCSSFSPVHWHSRARESCCASACAAEFNAGLDSPTHSLTALYIPLYRRVVRLATTD